MIKDQPVTVRKLTEKEELLYNKPIKSTKRSLDKSEIESKRKHWSVFSQTIKMEKINELTELPIKQTNGDNARTSKSTEILLVQLQYLQTKEYPIFYKNHHLRIWQRLYHQFQRMNLIEK